MSSHTSIETIPPWSLEAILTLPPKPRGLVIFAHGSGSGRLSPRNRHVAEGLQEAELATLLFDLLTPEESDDRQKVFDIELLAGRLVGATHWAREQPAVRALEVGYFGASTGAAAALVAAASMPEGVGAIVSRGGRPDLAMEFLSRVRAPTLLIVGALDRAVVELNNLACDRLQCEKRLSLVAGATHLFEEPGTLEEVVELARDWFSTHLVPQDGSK